MATNPILGGVGLGMCEPCRSPGAFWYPPLLDDVPALRGIWMCDSCVHPDIVRARIDRDLQARDHQRMVAKLLANGRCPYSGLLLRLQMGWGQKSMMCSMCDCFGFDPADPRLLAEMAQNSPPGTIPLQQRGGDPMSSENGVS